MSFQPESGQHDFHTGLRGLKFEIASIRVLRTWPFKGPKDFNIEHLLRRRNFLFDGFGLIMYVSFSVLTPIRGKPHSGSG